METNWKGIAIMAADWAYAARFSDHRGIVPLIEIPPHCRVEHKGITVCFANVGDEGLVSDEADALMEELEQWGSAPLAFSRSTPNKDHAEGYSWAIVVRASIDDVAAAWRIVVDKLAAEDKPVKGQLWNLGREPG